MSAFLPMSNISEFPVKGTISDADYDMILQTRVLDKRKNALKVGDFVAYGSGARYTEPVNIGEILSVEIFYRPYWDRTVGKYYHQNNYMNADELEIKVSIKTVANRKIIRDSRDICKVV